MTKKLSAQNKPLFALASELGCINLAFLGEGICLARGANLYTIIFDPDNWQITVNDPEADYRNVKGKRVGYVLQSGSGNLTAVVSEAKRIFHSKSGAGWITDTQPTVLTMRELAAAEAAEA